VAEKGELNRLYQDHQEIDAHLRDAALATEFGQAARLLQAGLSASREHFSREEETIFPLLEKLLTPAALGALGTAVATGASPLGTHGFANALRGRLLGQAGSTLTTRAASAASQSATSSPPNT